MIDTRSSFLVAVALGLALVVGCGDNTSAGFGIDAESTDPDVADELEDIEVIVTDICARTVEPVTSPELERAPEAASSTASSLSGLERAPQTGGDDGYLADLEPRDPATAPGFCDVEVAPSPSGSSDVATLSATSTVCDCQYPDCVADAIDESFGCDVCVEFVCGDTSRYDCVTCD